jgi:ATP-binding cassette subfamily B (MDR/TAP) protein 1
MECIDFHEILSPIVSICAMLALVYLSDVELEKLDVKTTFLHGNLDDEIYMEKLEGFFKDRKRRFSCNLKKSFYGLKQSPRQWYKKI